MNASMEGEVVYEYKVVEVVRVVDGDTLDLRISLGFGMTASMRFRLQGLDAPEIYGKFADPVRGPAAIAHVHEWLAGRRVKILTEKGTASSVGVGDGAFGRWLATPVDIDTGEVLQDALRAAGFTK